MKYSAKVFLSMVLVITIGFSIFGNYLLYSFFQTELSRVTDQGIRELEWFEYIFSISYTEDPDTEKAALQCMVNIRENLQESDNQYFLFQNRFVYDEFRFTDENIQTGVQSTIQNMIDNYSDDISEIITLKKLGRQGKERYFTFNLSKCSINDEVYYLGFCKDITDIYVTRDSMIKQYQFAMLFILLFCGIIIYLLTRYLTKPLEKLSQSANAVAEGNYEIRSNISANDEIGLLSRNIDHMTDQLVDNMNQLQAEMERKVLEAKQKEDFIAAFSHELKTPLTSIIGYSDMLSSVEMTEEEKAEAYFYIFHQGKRLQNLSYKLMELVSIEHQNLKLKTIQMHDLEEQLLKVMKFRWKENPSKKIYGRIHLGAGKINGDIDLLLSLFTNFLDNATKAIEQEGFVLMTGEQQPEGYQVKIMDNGCGIPQNEISRITEPFYMVDKSRSRKEGGAGIGLSLCQKIILLHHASFHIKSKVAEGTIIQIDFPAVPETPKKRSPKAYET